MLAADAPVPAEAVGAVLDAACSLGPVVIDLGRYPGEPRAAALTRCCFVMVVAVGEMCGLPAARAAVSNLSPVSPGVVVRRGPVAADEAAALVGAPLVGELPPITPRRDRTLDPGRLPGAAARLAAGILDGLRP